VLRFIRESRTPTAIRPRCARSAAGSSCRRPPRSTCTWANLERLGFIRRDPTKPRALELVDTPRPLRPLPLVGQVAAGLPILAEQNVEDYIEVPALLRRSDDDFSAARRRRLHDRRRHPQRTTSSWSHRQATADNGDIVVALVGDEATTKRFFREAGRIRLQPATISTNPSSSTRSSS